MIRGVFAPMVVLVLAIAVWIGLTRTRPVEYFPEALRQQTITCDFGSGAERFPVIENYLADAVSDQLHAAEEPSLFSGAPSPATSSVRVGVFPAYHEAVIVRIDEFPGGNARMAASLVSPRNRRGPVKLVKRIARVLNPAERTAFRQLLAETRALDQRPQVCNVPLHAIPWILEGTGPQGYRYVNRWGPDAVPVATLSKFMLKLTGWELHPYYGIGLSEDREPAAPK